MHYASSSIMHHMSRPAQLVTLPAIADARGHLGVVSAAHDLGFPIRRLFYIHHTPATAHRGGHAHKALQQFLLVIGNEPIALRLDNGYTQTVFQVQPYTQGLYIPPMHWVDIENIPAGSCILVACSDEYDEADYLRSYSDFLQYSRGQDK